MPDFVIVDHAAEPTAVVHAIVKASDLPTFFSRALPRVLAAMETQHTAPGGEPFAYYHGIPDGTVNVETGFPIHGGFVASGDVVPSELPSGRIVIGMHFGPSERLAETYGQMATWAAAHGLKPQDEMWEVYLTDPEREPNPTRWQTRIFLRVEQTSAAPA